MKRNSNFIQSNWHGQFPSLLRALGLHIHIPLQPGAASPPFPASNQDYLLSIFSEEPSDSRGHQLLLARLPCI